MGSVTCSESWRPEALRVAPGRLLQLPYGANTDGGWCRIFMALPSNHHVESSIAGPSNQLAIVTSVIVKGGGFIAGHTENVVCSPAADLLAFRIAYKLNKRVYGEPRSLL